LTAPLSACTRSCWNACSAWSPRRRSPPHPRTSAPPPPPPHFSAPDPSACTGPLLCVVSCTYSCLGMRQRDFVEVYAAISSRDDVRRLAGRFPGCVVGVGPGRGAATEAAGRAQGLVRHAAVSVRAQVPEARDADHVHAPRRDGQLLPPVRLRALPPPAPQSQAASPTPGRAGTWPCVSGSPPPTRRRRRSCCGSPSR
jgi:hypothetical protein